MSLTRHPPPILSQSLCSLPLTPIPCLSLKSTLTFWGRAVMLTDGMRMTPRVTEKPRTKSEARHSVLLHGHCLRFSTSARPERGDPKPARGLLGGRKGPPPRIRRDPVRPHPPGPHEGKEGASCAHGPPGNGVWCEPPPAPGSLRKLIGVDLAEGSCHLD